MNVRGLALGLFTLFAVAAPVTAQERTGSIAGSVRDSSGAILPGATVQATSPSLVGIADGGCRQPGQLPLSGADARRLRDHGDLAGIHHRQGHRRADDDRPAAQDRSCAVAGDADRERHGHRRVADHRREAERRDGIDQRRRRLSACPKARDFTDLLRTAPGTQQERKSGIQIDGAGGAEHRYVIDGMDTTGIRTGVSGQEMPIDFVAGGPGQVVRLQRRVPRHHRRRDQRHHQDRQQRLAWRRRLLLPQQQLQRRVRGPNCGSCPPTPRRPRTIIRPDDEFSRTSRRSISAVRSGAITRGSMSAPRRTSIAPDAR